jgi:hypothetical protein
MPARFVVDVPTGYALDLSAQPGETVAVVSLSVVGADSSFENGFGDLKAADPAAYASDPCAPGLHAAVWTVPMSIAGQRVVLTVFVDPGGGPGVAYTLQACPPPVPARGGSARVTLVVTDLLALARPSAPGRYVWRTVATPPTGDAYELQAVEPVPERALVQARYDARARTAIVSGRVLADGQPVAGAGLLLETAGLDGPSLEGRTASDGSFALRVGIRRTTDFLVTVSLVVGPCEVAPVAPGGCISSVTAAPGAATATAWVSIPGGARRAIRPADQRLAEREAPAASDLGPGYESAGSAGHACRNPGHEPDLTITGELSSPVFGPYPAQPARPSFAATGLARVYRNAGQARAAFEREAVRATAECQLADASVRKPRVRSFALSVPARMRGFRRVIHASGIVLDLDVVFLQRGRSVVRLVLSTDGSPGRERQLAATVAARMR